MIATNSGLSRGDAFDKELVAELTMAAYLVALRHCAASKWLDLQLELWRVVSTTVANGGSGFPDQIEPTDFLAELAYIAYRTALPFGRRQSFLDLELELYQTLRTTLECEAHDR